MKKPKIALIILNYNSRSHLPDLFSSLKSQTFKNFDTYLFDNASQDQSLTFVRQNYSWVKIVENKKNLGYGGGLYQAVEYLLQKKYDYFAFLNPDIRLAPDWLNQLFKTLRKDPKTAIVAPLSLSWDGKTVDCAGGSILNLAAGIFTGFLGGEKYQDIPSPFRLHPFPVFFGLTIATLFKKEVFLKYGSFDKDYFMYMVDNDLSWRLLLAGQKIICQPQALCYHRGHGSQKTRSLELKITGEAETNLLATYYKNLSLLNFLLLLPILTLFRLFFSLIYLPLSPALGLVKIKGILHFYINLLTLKYQKKRRFAQNLRQISDKKVLLQNPTPIFAFSPILKLLFPHLNQLTKLTQK